MEEPRTTPVPDPTAGRVDEPVDRPSAASGPASATSEPGSGWTTGTTSQAEGPEWLAQLQSMIEGLATQAAPVVREIGAKAAELAALAGEKAGPIAHRAAEATEHAGARIAERGRVVAAELRRDVQPGNGDGAGGSASPDEPATTTSEPPETTPVP